MTLDILILGALAVLIIWSARNDRAIQAIRRSK